MGDSSPVDHTHTAGEYEDGNYERRYSRSSSQNNNNSNNNRDRKNGVSATTAVLSAPPSPTHSALGSKSFTQGALIRRNELNSDDQELEDLGYKQVLSRGFNALSNFSFCFTAVAVISSITSTYTYGLATGGPAVMMNGWIICSFFTVLTGSIMAEICSVYPSAGSVYYWSSLLAPEPYAPLAAFITGWFNLLGNAAGDAAYAFAFGQVLFEMLDFAYPNDPLFGLSSSDPAANKFIVGVAIAVATAWALINLLPTSIQSHINNGGAFWQVSTMVVVIVTLLSVSPVREAGSFVFTQTNNETGFMSDDSNSNNTNTNSMVYLSCIGLLTSLFSFSGYEAGGHMAEETTNAARAAPLGILYTTMVSSVVGFAYIIGLLLNTYADANGSLRSQDPITIIIAVMGPNGGLAVSSLLLVNFFFSGIASMTVTTRALFAMARDGAIPFSPTVIYVHPRTKTPVVTVLCVFVFDCVLVCICLGATQAFYAITGLTTIGYQISYAIPITLRLLKPEFKQGEINLGSWSYVVGWTSVVWLIVTSLFFFLPTAFPVTAANMNYTCVVVSAVAIISGVYWLLSARFFFQGPFARAKAAAAMNAKRKLFLARLVHVNASKNEDNGDGSDNSSGGSSNDIEKINLDEGHIVDMELDSHSNDGNETQQSGSTTGSNSNDGNSYATGFEQQMDIMAATTHRSEHSQ